MYGILTRYCCLGKENQLEPVLFDYKGWLASFRDIQDLVGLNENGFWTWFQCYLMPSLYHWEEFFWNKISRIFSCFETVAVHNAATPGPCDSFEVSRLPPPLLHSKTFQGNYTKRASGTFCLVTRCQMNARLSFIFTIDYMLNLSINFGTFSCSSQKQCQDK